MAIEDRGSGLQDWREALWSAFVRLDSVSDDRTFYGNVVPSFARSSLLTDVRSTCQVTERTSQHIKSDPSEWLFVALQIDGCGHAEQNGRLAQTPAGHFTFYRTDKPYRLGFAGPFEQLITHLPLAQIAARVPNLDQLTARPFDATSGAGAIFSDFVRGLSNRAPGLGESAAEQYAPTLVELLLSTLASVTEPTADRRDVRFQHLTRQLAAHLHDPEFDLTAFCAAKGQSVRSVQRVFHAQGTTPSRWLLEQRLSAAARALERPSTGGRAGKSVTEICFDWGFRDLSHFSTAFRQKFGKSPQAWRKMHRGQG